MHELGIMIKVVETVERVMQENDVEKVDTIILQVGELSSVVPQYIHSVFPAAVDGTALEDTKLSIEILPANAICKECKKVYNVIKEKGTCPQCTSGEYEVLSGKEFMIKEIVCT